MKPSKVYILMFALMVQVIDVIAGPIFSKGFREGFNIIYTVLQYGPYNFLDRSHSVNSYENNEIICSISKPYFSHDELKLKALKLQLRSGYNPEVDKQIKQLNFDQARQDGMPDLESIFGVKAQFDLKKQIVHQELLQVCASKKVEKQCIAEERSKYYRYHNQFSNADKKGYII